MADRQQQISDYVGRTVRLCRELAPDLCFGEADEQRRLIYDGLKGECRFVRVTSGQPGVLHLKWIEVYARTDDGIENVAPRGSVSVSSTRADKADFVTEGQFLRAHSRLYGFHTEREERPWVRVDLGASYELSRIVLVNRADQFAGRAAKLIVEASSDGEDWRMLYHHAESEAGLLATLARRRRHAEQRPELELGEAIDPLIVHALSADYLTADALLVATPGLSWETKSQIARAITEHVLARRKLEWTNHLIKCTFRYWSTEQKAAYLRFTNEAVEELVAEGYEACLGYGSVLSIVRDHDLIKHDDDLDVIVSLPRHRYATIGDGLEEISDKLRSRGFMVKGDYASHRHASRDGHTAIDVFAGFEEGEFVSWLPGPRGVLRKSDVFPPIRCWLFGVECIVPRNPFRYVEAVYGPNWMVPISRWNHNWDRTGFSDWFVPQENPAATAASG